MKVVFVSAVPNTKGALEIVKEITDDLGNVTYGLQILPKQAVVQNAAVEGIDDSSEAIDATLYPPYLANCDVGVTMNDQVQQCKNRITPTIDDKPCEQRQTEMFTAGVPEYYHPIEAMDPIETIRAFGGVTTESILEVRAELTQEEPDGAVEQLTSGEQLFIGEQFPIGEQFSIGEQQRSRKEGRPRPRRAYISLGAVD